MKKILNILTLMEPGGVQQREFMFRSYNKEFYEVKSVFFYKKIDSGVDKEGICIYQEKPSLLKIPLVFIKLFLFIMKYKPDLIMTWGWTANSFGMLASLLHFRCKRIVMQTSPAYEHKLLKGRLRLTGSTGMVVDKFLGVLGLYDLNIMVSQHNMNSYASYPKAYLKNCKVIFNGVSFPNITEADPITLDVLKGKKLIGSVGRLSKVKNHISVIRALKHIHDVHYAIIGQGPEKENLLKEADFQGVSDRLILIDSLSHDQIYSFLKKLSVFMFPSLSESFGLAGIEAASIPLPLVVMDAPWSIDMLGRDFPTLVKNDANKIAIVTNRILSDVHYSDNLRSLSLSIAKKYDFSYMANNYMAEIKKLIGV